MFFPNTSFMLLLPLQDVSNLFVVTFSHAKKNEVPLMQNGPSVLVRVYEHAQHKQNRTYPKNLSTLTSFLLATCLG